MLHLCAESLSCILKSLLNNKTVVQSERACASMHVREGRGRQVKSTSDMGSAHSSHSPTLSCYSQLIGDLGFAFIENDSHLSISDVSAETNGGC